MHDIEKTESRKKYHVVVKVGPYIRHFIGTFEEILEGLSIAYANYAVVAYYSKFQTKWGYLPVALGGALSGVFEILHINSVISNKQHHISRTVKESFAFNAIIAIYLEKFFDETPKAVALGEAVGLFLGSCKAAKEIFKYHPFFQTKLGQITKNTVDGATNGLVAAGINAYLFDIFEGFGLNVNPLLKTTVTASTILGAVMAGAVMNQYEKDRVKNCGYKISHSYLCGIYATDISLFLTIFTFDVITDIQRSTIIKDKVFYTVVTAAGLQAIIIMAKKLITDNKNKYIEAHSEREIENLLSHSKLQENKESCFSFKGFSRSCYNFLYPKDPVDQKLELYLERSKSSQWKLSDYLPSFSWLNGFKNNNKENLVIQEEGTNSSLKVIK